MSSKKIILALLLALLIPSALLVSLQGDCTDRDYPGNRLLFDYYSGAGPQDIVGSAAVPVVEARCLVRGVLEICEWVGSDRLPDYNPVIQTVSVWAALCMIYLTAARLMPPARAFAAVLLAVVFVPWGYLSIGYSVSWPYDLPSLFFASFGLWTILSRRFALFAVALVLGTLNKETIVFLLPAYVLAEWPLLPRKTLILRALLLAGLFLLTYEIPRMIITGQHLPVFTASVSDQDVPRWKNNLLDLAMKNRSTVYANVYSVLSIHLLPLLCLFRLPRPLRMGYLAVPVLLIPIFICGNIYEFRLYNEIIPLGAIATVFAVSRLLEAPAAPDPAVARPPTVP